MKEGEEKINEREKGGINEREKGEINEREKGKINERREEVMNERGGWGNKEMEINEIMERKKKERARKLTKEGN